MIQIKNLQIQQRFASTFFKNESVTVVDQNRSAPADWTWPLASWIEVKKKSGEKTSLCFIWREKVVNTCPILANFGWIGP